MERRGKQIVNRQNTKNLLPLFVSFLKIGTFTFGGGYAMIPLIQREVVEKKKWITDQEILEVVAIAESTPGPIAINAATFIGYRTAGFWGAFCATLGVVLPSFLIIAGISLVLRQFEDLKAVRYAFQGIRAGVLALLVRALVSLYRQCPRGRLSCLVIALAFLCTSFLQISVLWVILFSAAAGLACTALTSARKRHAP